MEAQERLSRKDAPDETPTAITLLCCPNTSPSGLENLVGLEDSCSVNLWEADGEDSAGSTEVCAYFRIARDDAKIREARRREEGKPRRSRKVQRCKIADDEEKEEREDSASFTRS